MPSNNPRETARITKRSLLDTIRRDREEFDAVIARVPPARMEEVDLAADGWSVKDVLWHIAWGDRQNEAVIHAKAPVGSDLWDLSEDERNAVVVREGRSRSLDEVIGEYRQSYAAFLSALERLSDADLTDAARWQGFATRVPGWHPWRVLYDPEHYKLHGGWIKDRLR